MQPDVADLNYEGALSDCHAAVDELAKCALRNQDNRSAWWLCANYPKRVNAYQFDARERLVANASWHKEPPGWKSWTAWMRRPEAQTEDQINIRW